ncbi:GNAT family N-acetyltransferase [Eubacterium oxidoreducens]|uniref:Protein N-acetyltransferase, RimJ/RimL family n=1 Tax=Eubacterium oxidoreducens TaxID=1732 RepID=A0A1G6AF23_EUBOX|nr:GNAT family N-acetyltransferase [Eubacterium oxidoreducens]SDB06995.1 Protein N-acetyltransferase, RimJ/RimL family [Eubacterium oxidoreducens]
MTRLTHVFYEEAYFTKDKVCELENELEKRKIKLYPATKYADVKPENMLLMTGTQNMVDFAYDNKIAVLGLEKESAQTKLSKVRYVYMDAQMITADDILLVYNRFHGYPMTIGYTMRTKIRELALEDLDDLFRLYAKKGICDYIEPLYEREEEEQYQKAYIQNMYGLYGYGMWLVFDKTKNQLIGRAGIEQRTVQGRQVIEFGYVMDVSYQRQGYATEVCEFLLSYAKEELGENLISAFVHPENEPSIRLLDKIGFVQKKELLLDGKKMLWFEREMGL